VSGFTVCPEGFCAAHERCPHNPRCPRNNSGTGMQALHQIMCDAAERPGHALSTSSAGPVAEPRTGTTLALSPSVVPVIFDPFHGGDV